MEQASTDDPSPFIVPLPDDNRFVVTARDNPSPTTTAAPRWQHRSIRRDVLWCPRSNALPYSDIRGPYGWLLIDGAYADCLEVILVDRAGFSALGFLAARQVPEAGLDSADQIRMPEQTGHRCTSLAVVDLDSVITAPAYDSPTVILNAGDTFVVAGDRPHARPILKVPHLDRPIPRGRHHLVAMYLNRVDRRVVPGDGHQERQG